MSESNGYITADALDRFADARKTVEIEIEGFGKFRLREWCGVERSLYVDLAEKFNSTRHSIVGITLTLVDADGNLMFDQSDETIEKMLQWPSRVLDRLSDEMISVNGLQVELEETAKN